MSQPRDPRRGREAPVDHVLTRLDAILTEAWADGSLDDIVWAALDTVSQGALPTSFELRHLRAAAITGLLDIANLDHTDAARRFRSLERHWPALRGLLIISEHPDLPYAGSLGLVIPDEPTVHTVIYLRVEKALTWLAARVIGPAGDAYIVGREPADPDAIRARGIADLIRADVGS